MGMPENGGATGKCLPAATGAAGAAGATWIDHHVAELTGKMGAATVDRTINEYSAANTVRGDLDIERVLVAACRAEDVLRKECGVRRLLHDDWQAIPRLEDLA